MKRLQIVFITLFAVLVASQLSVGVNIVNAQGRSSSNADASAIKKAIEKSQKIKLSRVEVKKTVGNYAFCWAYVEGGESADVVLKKNKSSWKVIDLGTDLDKDDLIKNGVPASLFK